MKAAELRQSILQAAMQGKLVPQNLHDKPASELLSQIQRKKAELAREGKIKKEKPLPKIEDYEIPFEIPRTWKWCRLLDLCKSIADGDHQPPPQATFGIPFLVISNISLGRLDFSNTRYVSEAYFKNLQQERIAEIGDILFSVTGSYGIPISVETTKQFCFQRHIALLKPLIQKEYLYYLLSSPIVKNQCDKAATGTAQKTVGLKSLKSMVVPLPPLAEQCRIVAKVEKLLALCDELETEEKKLDALEAHFTEYLPKAILQAAVQGKLVPQNSHDEPASELLKRIQQEKAQLVKEGKIKREKPLPPISEDEIPYDLPEGWKWCRLGELCNYGTAQNIQPDEILADDWVLELEDVEKDTGKLLCKKSKSQRNPVSTKHCFRPNDILYSKLRPYLNKVLIAEDYGYCTSEILPLSFYGELNVRYALIFLRSPLFIDYANRCSYGVKMPRLGTNDGKAALVPLPPLEEQQRIVVKLDELMALCDELSSIYIAPIELDQAVVKIIPFPTAKKEEETLLAARGDVGQLSNEAMRAIDDLFSEDEE